MTTPHSTTPGASSAHNADAVDSEDALKKYARWRRSLGLIMLAAVVFLYGLPSPPSSSPASFSKHINLISRWTASNFLGSAVLADNSFNKPFFITYYNTAFFVIPLLPALFTRLKQDPDQWRSFWYEGRDWLQQCLYSLRLRRRPADSLLNSPLISAGRQSLSDSREMLLSEPHEPLPTTLKVYGDNEISDEQLSIFETAKLGAEFCGLWFLANWWIAMSLEYTTVASSTILTSTSSVFTLVFGVFFRVEIFTWRKVIGILASLSGIIIVSSVDISGRSGDDEHRGDFPMKSASELILGNALALLSALTYGIYTVFMKKRIDDESKVSMPLFFGFVGLINVLVLWPGFFILHWTGIETFELPSDARVTAIITTNCLTSLIADMCWAYAVLLTTPLVVTVGLSLTIPLSLVGQVVLNSQTATAPYWIGAVIVVASFIFINHEEKKEELPHCHDDNAEPDRPLPAL